MMFNAAESDACLRLVEMALREDLGSSGDATSALVIPRDLQGKAVFVARSEGVVAGLPAAELVLKTLHAPTPQASRPTPHVIFQSLLDDGARVNSGDRLAVIAGPMQFILTAERTALNFLRHLSGIATVTRRYVDAVAGLSCQILDTRKTTPGWRLLEKYAVRCGGGKNHRMGLYDGILVKDNHLAALGGGRTAFARLPLALDKHRLSLEIEVDTLEQLDWALECTPDIILLDNMNVGQLREAVRRRQQAGSNVLLEASGGVTLDTVRAIAETGIDRISVGALTHSATALDVGLDYSV
jgi:nicotinate-nucleotide pyrophosphorylase (carboxylating)